MGRMAMGQPNRNLGMGQSQHFKNSLIAQTLCLAKDLGLAINAIDGKQNIYKIEAGKTPFLHLDIFRESYRREKSSIRSKELLYLEQIIYNNTLKMRNWDELPRKHKGKIPYWWEKLKNYVLEQGKLSLKEN